MASLRQLLLKEAARRFEDQQEQNLAAAAASAILMAPISPSPPHLIGEAFKRLADERDDATGIPLVGTGSQFIDLGCGDGRWLSAAATCFKDKQVRCVGYDLDETLLRKARAAAMALHAQGAAVSVPEATTTAEAPLPPPAQLTRERVDRLPTLEYRNCDLLTADVSHASIVIAYLFREGCFVVQEKLEKELSPTGTAVLSVGFSLKGWEVRWVIRPKGSVPLYFYTPPWRQKRNAVLLQPATAAEVVCASDDGVENCAGVAVGGGAGAALKPGINLSEVLAKKQGLKDSGMGNRTHTGGITRDEATGRATLTGFTVFTPEHERLMHVFQANALRKEEEGSGGGGGGGGAAAGARDWTAMAALLPEYGLSAALLSRLAPPTAKAFAWNVTEGRYAGESLAAATGGRGDVALNAVQLAKDMEHKPGGGVGGAGHVSSSILSGELGQAQDQD